MGKIFCNKPPGYYNGVEISLKELKDAEKKIKKNTAEMLKKARAAQRENNAKTAGEELAAASIGHDTEITKDNNHVKLAHYIENLEKCIEALGLKGKITSKSSIFDESICNIENEERRNDLVTNLVNTKLASTAKNTNNINAKNLNRMSKRILETYQSFMKLKLSIDSKSDSVSESMNNKFRPGFMETRDYLESLDNIIFNIVNGDNFHKDRITEILEDFKSDPVKKYRGIIDSFADFGDFLISIGKAGGRLQNLSMEEMLEYINFDKERCIECLKFSKPGCNKDVEKEFLSCFEPLETQAKKYSAPEHTMIFHVQHLAQLHKAIENHGLKKDDSMIKAYYYVTLIGVYHILNNTLNMYQNTELSIENIFEEPELMNIVNKIPGINQLEQKHLGVKYELYNAFELFKEMCPYKLN